MELLKIKMDQAGHDVPGHPDRVVKFVMVDRAYPSFDGSLLIIPYPRYEFRALETGEGDK